MNVNIFITYIGYFCCRIFEKIVRYCDTFSSQLPLSFILGFYVTYVAKRWWNQYLAIPWPDKYIVDLVNIDTSTKYDRFIFEFVFKSNAHHITVRRGQ
jgi:hypothetical protein